MPFLSLSTSYLHLFTLRFLSYSECDINPSTAGAPYESLPGYNNPALLWIVFSTLPQFRAYNTRWSFILFLPQVGVRIVCHF